MSMIFLNMFFVVLGSVSHSELPPLNTGGEDISRIIQAYCLDCHSGGGANEPLLGSLRTPDGVRDADPELLQDIRDRLRARDMPPLEMDLDFEERMAIRPTEEHYLKGIEDLGRVLRMHTQKSRVPSVVLRRLNRVEYANAVRELIGVDVDTSTLPSDDVGQAFDHLGEVLSMSPLLLEKTMNLAEDIARKAIIDAKYDSPDVLEFMPASLFGAKVRRDAAWRNSSGEVYADVVLPQAGTYRAEFVLAGQQAGPDPVLFSLRVNHDERDRVRVPESIENPSTHSITFRTTELDIRVGAAFLNDYNRPKLKGKPRDRNAAIIEIRVVGPLDPSPPLDIQRALTAKVARHSPRVGMARAARWLLEQAWRRPIKTDEALRIADTLLEVEGVDQGLPNQLRTLITYALMSPEFLYRFEQAIPDSEPHIDGSLPLDDYSLATRLASFMFSSIPDQRLLKVARNGGLRSEKGIRKEVRKMLDDPRSRSIAERFAVQWLRIDAVERLDPDSTMYGKIDEVLLRDMREETILVFDDVLRSNRPLWDLFRGNETFLNARLADHYGIELPKVLSSEDDFQKVRMDRLDYPVAGVGILAHASILTSTSNPTRTSPVKRGKWVLEALLDSPPPPPPPGVDQLPPAVDGDDTASVRAMLERHRADPDCAVCHIRMDAMGLALESLNGVGRYRNPDEFGIDVRTELPDGSAIHGVFGLANMLEGNRDVLRSISRHMLVFALGRSIDWRDEPLLDDLIMHLEEDPTLGTLIEEIAVSPQFRRMSNQ